MIHTKICKQKNMLNGRRKKEKKKKNLALVTLITVPDKWNLGNYQLERVIVWHSSSIAISRGVGLELGEGNGNPLQDSCLETPMDGGAW